MIRLALAFLVTAAWPLGPAAEELKFDFSQTKVGKRPDKFSATFLGKDDLSSPAKWQVTETRTPSSLATETVSYTHLRAHET